VLARDVAFVTRLQAALAEIGPLLASQPNLLPANYTGFVARDNAFYKPIRDAGWPPASWAHGDPVGTAPALGDGARGLPAGRAAFAALVAFYAALVAVCLATLVAAGDLSFGRNPWDNLLKTVGDFARPSFLDAWFGPERLEYRSDDGTVLRVENRLEVEATSWPPWGGPPG
jgi:hypothetical protein